MGGLRKVPPRLRWVTGNELAEGATQKTPRPRQLMPVQRHAVDIWFQRGLYSKIVVRRRDTAVP